MSALDNVLAAIRARDTVACPHCRHEADMTDCEAIQGHVTYWGEDGPKPFECHSCGTTFYLKENITRSWTAGRTPDEADEL
jgi:transposase-like protein